MLQKSRKSVTIFPMTGERAVKIESGLMPDDVQPLRKMKYPWLELNIGESFEIDTSIEVAKTNAKKASARYKKTFQAGMSKGKVRIWRWK